jgi:hypothetical protein
MWFPVLLLRRLYQKQKFILLAILIIILLRNMRAKSESFVTFGDYPRTVDLPLLDGVYPIKKDMNLSSQGRDKLYELYPVYSSNSSDINNIKDWQTPDNGNCSPAELCNVIYDIKPVQAHESIQSSSDPWNNKRIGFY